MNWKDIDGTDGHYQVSDEGKFRHIWKNGNVTFVKPYLMTKNGGQKIINLYVTVRCADGKRKTKSVTYFVTHAFLPPAPPGYIYVHANHQQYDNRVENFILISRAELGIRSAGRHGRCVEKIDRDGNVVELYRSILDAAKANYIDDSAVLARCQGRIRDPFKLIGYSFRYEDEPWKSKIRRSTEA